MGSCASEKSLDKQVKKLIESRGGFAAKIHGHAFQAVLPDFLVCYKGRFLGFEDKSAHGTHRPGQKSSLIMIQRAGGIAETVYHIDQVRAILDQIDAEEAK